MVLLAPGLVGILAVLLSAMVVADIRRGLIPNWINLLIAAAGLVRALLRAPTPETLFGEASAGAAVFSLLTLLLWLARRLDARATMGGGDVKFLMAASLWVGVTGSFAVLFVASFAVTIIGIARSSWRRSRRGARIAFAPMLAAGMIWVVSNAVIRSGGFG